MPSRANRPRWSKRQRWQRGKSCRTAERVARVDLHEGRRSLLGQPLDEVHGDLEPPLNLVGPLLSLRCGVLPRGDLDERSGVDVGERVAGAAAVLTDVEVTVDSTHDVELVPLVPAERVGVVDGGEPPLEASPLPRLGVGLHGQTPIVLARAASDPNACDTTHNTPATLTAIAASLAASSTVMAGSWACSLWLVFV